MVMKMMKTREATMAMTTKMIATRIFAVILMTQLIACAPGCSFTEGFLPAKPTSVKGGIDIAKGMIAVVASTAADLREDNHANPAIGINAQLGTQIERYLIDARATIRVAEDFDKTGDLTNAEKTLAKAYDALNAAREIINNHGGKI